MANTYRVEGSGETSKKALSALAESRSSLERQLADASTAVLEAPTKEYRVTFKLNDEPVGLASFSPEIIGVSSASFKEAEARATLGFQGLRYDCRGYNVAEVYALTEEQLAAVQSTRVLGAQQGEYGLAVGSGRRSNMPFRF